MKKLLLTIVLIISVMVSVFAQAPQKFSYQAVVRNESNTLVRGTVGVRVSILQGGITGNTVYSETHVATTNTNGLMTLEIGAGTAVSGDFSTIDWADGPYFLKTETDPDGGTNYTIEGTQQLLSVPYALYAATSGNGAGPQGPQGEQGPAGPQGEQGPQGEVGPQGEQGPQGEVGPQGPAGQNGADGLNGQDGLSAYQIWLNAGNNGTEAEFLASLVGAQGPQGEVGPQGPAGQNGADGLNGQDGLSAYQIWLNAGNNGTEAEFLTSLVGAQGPQGEQGIQGEQGVAGPQGERGLQGEQGPQGEVGPQGPAGQNGADGLNGQDGLSAYQIWLNAGNNGTEAEFLASLVGAQGPQGEVGPQGPAGVGIPQTLSITGNQLSISDGNSVDLPEGFDGDYNSLTNRPTIPTVPTNVSAFTNDAGYLTQATVQEAANIPTQVSAFNNDAGYITSADVPTNVSELNNDANYITSAQVPAQVNADWNATEGAAQIMNKPALFSGDYNDLSNQPTIPTVPTNVSAFTNDAGYVTQSTLTTENYITQNDLITNNYVTAADIPTQVSAFNNDAGYITSADVPTNVSELNNDANYITSAQVPAQVNADWNATEGAAQILNKPELFSGDYNDLSNQPTIPTVPTNVSAFTNDAGYVTQSTLTTENYITQNDLITNNYVTAADIPTQVSAFNNDAGYITSADVPTNVSELNNDANYITAADIPAYQVLSISNDTIFLSNGGYAILPAGFDGDYNSLSNRPNLFSGDYNDLNNRPEIPTVPTNVSAFTNDAGYLTQATVQEAANIPTQISAFENDANYITAAEVPAQVNADWNATEGAAQILNKPELFSGDYNDLSNQPTIPTTTNELTNNSGFITNADIPTNVSAFTNDADYITSANVPTNVSELNNDAGYITSYTEQQILSISNDTIYLTGGSFVKLPAGFSGSYNDLRDVPTLFDGDYNSLTNTPEIPEVNNATLTIKQGETTLGTFTANANAESMITIPEIAVPENVSTFNNDAGYLTRDSLENYNMTPSDIQDLLDRIAALEHSNAIPAVITDAIISNGEGNIITGGNVYSSGTSAVTARGVCWGTNENPTIEGNHTSDGAGVGIFSSNINGLVENTTYYIRAYATNATGTTYGIQYEYSFIPCGTATVLDADGNSYNTVLIGTQCWMKENLRTTKKPNGSTISSGIWAPGSISVTTYGRLYSWETVTNGAPSSNANPSGVQGICPDGWHVPSDNEWKQMEMAVGMSQSVADNTGWRGNIAAKLSGNTGWTSSSNGNAAGNLSAPDRNSSGFSALPAGKYYSSYGNFGGQAYFWSATEDSSDTAYYRYLSYSDAGVGRVTIRKTYGFSVRCVRDY